MKKLLLLWLVFIVASLFLFLPRIGPRDYFWFSDQELFFATHVYFIFERVSFILLAYLIYNEATEYRQELRVFMWLLAADLADYLLCYNEVWFYAGEFPVSMNMVKVIVFGVVILKAWSQRLF